jgi:hypothetical protein
MPFDGSRESYPDWKIKVHTKHVFLGNADILRYSIADAAISVIANGAQGYAAFVRKNQVIRYELIQGCTG